VNLQVNKSRYKAERKANKQRQTGRQTDRKAEREANKHRQTGPGMMAAPSALKNYLK
jgi:hypothetical protein